MVYQIKIESFEGPMDLLLHLIRKSQVRIEDIFISQITEQYLEYVRHLETADMELASEFIAMSAFLMEIKSRALLPRMADSQEPTAEEMEQMLIAQLEEYTRFKEVSGVLARLEQGQRLYHTKLPEEITRGETEWSFDDVSLNALNEAFIHILKRTPEPKPQERVTQIYRDPMTVDMGIRQILNRLKRRKSVRFSQLFTPSQSKNELVALFMAVLELLRQDRLMVEQEEPFGEIMLSLRTMQMGMELE